MLLKQYKKYNIIDLEKEGKEIEINEEYNVFDLSEESFPPVMGGLGRFQSNSTSSSHQNNKTTTPPSYSRNNSSVSFDLTNEEEEEVVTEIDEDEVIEVIEIPESKRRRSIPSATRSHSIDLSNPSHPSTSSNPITTKSSSSSSTTSTTTTTIPTTTTTTTTTTIPTTNHETINLVTTEPTPPTEELFLHLLEMGYEEDQIEHVLLRCNSISTAVNLLNNATLPTNKEPPPVYLSECPICFEKYPLDEIISLGCFHRLCLDCFKLYCESKINDNEVLEDQLCCPVLVQSTSSSSTVATTSKCSHPITIHEIRPNISPEVFEKYERFLTRSFCENQKLTSCPKCNDWYIDLSDVMHLEHTWKQIKCGKCSHPFCGKCGQVPHKGQSDQDIDCEAYAKWQEENSKTDDNFMEYINKNKLFSCPKCKMFGALESGCKFMTCRCREHYCALCGQKLTQAEHFSHFQGFPGSTGPFGNVCRGLKEKKDEKGKEKGKGKKKRRGRGAAAAVEEEEEEEEEEAVAPAPAAIAPDVPPVPGYFDYFRGMIDGAANALFGFGRPAAPPPQVHYPAPIVPIPRPILHPPVAPLPYIPPPAAPPRYIPPPVAPPLPRPVPAPRQRAAPKPKKAPAPRRKAAAPAPVPVAPPPPPLPPLPAAPPAAYATRLSKRKLEEAPAPVAAPAPPPPADQNDKKKRRRR